MALAAPRQPAPSVSTTTLGWHAISQQTLLVYAEQGLGDTLQFVRYLPQRRSARPTRRPGLPTRAGASLAHLPWGADTRGERPAGDGESAI